MDRCAISKDFHSISRVLFFRLTIWDVAGNEANFNIEVFLLGGGVNDIHHSIMAVHCRRHVAKKASREDIIRSGKSMSAKEDSAFRKPSIEHSIPFQLPEWKSGADAKVEANDITVVVVGAFVRRDTDAINVLRQFFARRDVIFVCNRSKRRSWFNRENTVLFVDFLKCLQEVAKERLDGIIGDNIGRAMDVNMDEGFVHCFRVIIFGEDAMRENGWGVGRKGRRASIGRGAGVGSVAHHHGRLGDVRRNQYRVYVNR